MRKVMVDIETLGVGNDAVVLSIAAVGFDIVQHPEGDVSMQVGPGRVWYPSLRQQFAMGRTVSAGTLEWWGRDEMAQAKADWAYLDGAKIEESIESAYQGFSQA